MATLEEDISAAASWISQALQSSGYKADFSFKSISEIERFFNEHTIDGAAVPEGLLSEQVGSRLFAIGSYCGEVLRRELGGAWQTDEEDPEGEINAVLQFEDGSICWPIQRVMKRFQGEEDDLVVWANYFKLNLSVAK